MGHNYSNGFKFSNEAHSFIVHEEEENGIDMDSEHDGFENIEKDDCIDRVYVADNSFRYEETVEIEEVEEIPPPKIPYKEFYLLKLNPSDDQGRSFCYEGTVEEKREEKDRKRKKKKIEEIPSLPHKKPYKEFHILKLNPNERFIVAKLGYEKESKSYKIEKFFALQPEHQLHEEELYIELCTHDFEVDINEDEGYPLKFIDLSDSFKGLIQYETHLKLEKRIHVIKIPTSRVPIMFYIDRDQNFLMEVDLSWTVAELKTAISKRYRLHSNNFELSFMNNILVESCLLCSYHIMRASMIFLKLIAIDKINLNIVYDEPTVEEIFSMISYSK